MPKKNSAKKKSILEEELIANIDKCLDAVLRTIYLLFNEGYYSISQDKTMRKDLCLEAIRLCTMLVENEVTNKPKVNALLALTGVFTFPGLTPVYRKMASLSYTKSKILTSGIQISSAKEDIF